MDVAFERFSWSRESLKVVSDQSLELGDLWSNKMAYGVSGFSMSSSVLTLSLEVMYFFGVTVSSRILCYIILTCGTM